MSIKTTNPNLKTEAEALVTNLQQGDRCASYHLARIIELDTQGVFEPFAQALTARLRDNIERWAELGVTDPDIVIEDEIYQLIKATAIDWNGQPCNGRLDDEV